MTDLAPRPPRLASELQPEEVGALAHDATYADASLSDVDWANQHADGVRMKTVRLVNVDVSGSRLEKLTLIDAELTGCNVANLQGRAAESPCRRRR